MKTTGVKRNRENEEAQEKEYGAGAEWRRVDPRYKSSKQKPIPDDAESPAGEMSVQVQTK